MIDYDKKKVQEESQHSSSYSSYAKFDTMMKDQGKVHGEISSG